LGEQIENDRTYQVFRDQKSEHPNLISIDFENVGSFLGVGSHSNIWVRAVAEAPTSLFTTLRLRDSLIQFAHLGRGSNGK
jgi:hypothetical protein